MAFQDVMRGFEMGQKIGGLYHQYQAAQAGNEATNVTDRQGLVDQTGNTKGMVYDQDTGTYVPSIRSEGYTGETPDNAVMPKYGLSGKTAYTMNGQDYDTAPTRAQKDAARLQAQRDYYASIGDQDKAMELGIKAAQLQSANNQNELFPLQKQHAELGIKAQEGQIEDQATERRRRAEAEGIDKVSAAVRSNASPVEVMEVFNKQGDHKFDSPPMIERIPGKNGRPDDYRIAGTVNGQPFHIGSLNAWESKNLTVKERRTLEETAANNAVANRKMDAYIAALGAKTGGLGSPIGMSDDGKKMLFSNPKSPNGFSEVEVPEGYSKMFPKITGEKGAKPFDFEVAAKNLAAAGIAVPPQKKDEPDEAYRRRAVKFVRSFHDEVNGQGQTPGQGGGLAAVAGMARGGQTAPTPTPSSGLQTRILPRGALNYAGEPQEADVPTPTGGALQNGYYQPSFDGLMRMGR